jgi:hypothetical protein
LQETGFWESFDFFLKEAKVALNDGRPLGEVGKDS